MPGFPPLQTENLTAFKEEDLQQHNPSKSSKASYRISVLLMRDGIFPAAIKNISFVSLMKKPIMTRFFIMTDGLMRIILNSILLLLIPSNIVIIREP